MKRLLILLLLLSGCAPYAQLAPSVTLKDLRHRAQIKPNDPQTQQDLAFGEMFATGGDQRNVLPQLRRALSLNKNSIRLEFVAGLYDDVHGYLDDALVRYTNVIRLAAGSTDPIAPQLSEIAVHVVRGLQDGIHGYRDKVLTALSSIAKKPDALAAPAREAANELLIDLAFRQGDLESVKRIASRSGCVTTWRVIGPFGPRSLLGFDTDHSVQPGAPLKEQYDLGPGRGVRDTRDILARGCRLFLGSGPVTQEGTSWAQAHVDIQSSGEYLMRIETPNSNELYVDGTLVQRLDFRKRLNATTTYLPVKLKAGKREITVKLTSVHSNPVVSVSVVPVGPKDLNAVELPYRDKQLTETESGFARYLNSTVLLLRGDAIGARESLGPVTDFKESSPILLLQRGGVALSDPLAPTDQRSDDARRLFEAAIKRDPGLWSPTLQLAKIEADNGRTTEAIERLRDATILWPNVLSIDLALIDLLRGNGWHSEADLFVKKIRQLLPDSCRVLQVEIDSNRRRQRYEESARISEELVACDARSNARYSTLLDRRRWKEAQAELDRLASLESNPNGFGTLIAQLDLAKNSGDEQKVAQTFEQLRKSYPRSETGLLEKIDRFLSQGKAQEAGATLKAAFVQEPAATLALQRLEKIASGEDELAPYRVDGAKVIQDFESSGHAYDQPQVLVFDYMVVWVYKDGSALELVHNIFKVQSSEAVDELGEIRVPEDARLLKAHTIKADKRRIEPDHISGKDTISLPNLIPGDYTEFEYVRPVDPPNGFPGGFLGDRFYFRSFEIPFDTSHLIVVLPRDLPVKIDPRGDAPPLEETVRDDVRVLSWMVHASPPLTREPLSVADREFIPSINYGMKATWDSFVESILDALADRDIVDPAIKKQVDDIVGETSKDDTIGKAKRIYEWVVRNVEISNDTFSQSALMLRARGGNRARILHYLYNLTNIPSDFALVRNAGNDATVSDLADTDTYDNLLLMVTPSSPKENKGPIWISTVDRWAPFGYVSPLLRGQKALLLKEGARVVQVRNTQDGEDRHRMQLDIELRANGSAKVNVIERLQGEGAVAWRQNLEGVPEADLEKRFEDEYVAHLVPGAILSSLKIIGRENPELEFQLEYSFNVASFGRRVTEGWALPGMLLSELATTYARISNRTTTEFVSPGIDRDVTLTIHVPQGTSFPRLPNELTYAGPNHASFRLANALKKGALIINRELRLPLMRVEPGHYTEFKNFCRSVDLAEAAEIVVKMP